MLGGLFFVPMVSLLGILIAWYRRDPRRFLDGPAEDAPLRLMRWAIGLLETSWEPGVGSRPPRHLYRLTGGGRDFVAALPAARAGRTVPARHSRWSEA